MRKALVVGINDYQGALTGMYNDANMFSVLLKER